MGYDEIVFLCHDIEDSLLNKASLDFIFKDLAQLKSKIRNAPKSKEYSLVHIEFLKNLKSIGNIKYSFDLDKCFLDIKNAILLKKIIVELIKNSYAHSQQLSAITIKGKIKERKYVISYEDNGKGVKKVKNVSYYSGRGVGLKSIYDIAKESRISILERDYKYKITLQDFQAHLNQ